MRNSVFDGLTERRLEVSQALVKGGGKQGETVPRLKLFVY